MTRARSWSAGALILLAASSAEAWLYSEPGQHATSVLIHSSRDVISGGAVSGTPDQLIVIRHARGSGHQWWRKVLAEDPRDRREVLLAEGPGGEVFAAGRSEDGRDGPYIGSLARLHPKTGVPVWEQELPELGIYAIAADPSGPLYVAGGVRGTDIAAEDLFVLKLDGATGQDLWQTTLGGAETGPDRGLALAIGASELLVAGILHNQADHGAGDFAVLKLDASSGAEIWRNSVPATGGHGGQAVAVDFAPNGDALVAGQAVQIGWCDFVVARFDSVDGHEIWRAVEDLGGCDGATDLALTSGGDILATGGGVTFSTLKLSGADGSILWRRDIPHIGPCTGGGCASGRAIASDEDDDAVITGRPAGGDFVTAKLAGGSGGFVWNQAFDLFGCSDNPRAMALSASGSLAIGGSAFEPIDGECAWPNGGLYFVMMLDAETGGDPSTVPALPGVGVLVLAVALLLASRSPRTFSTRDR